MNQNEIIELMIKSIEKFKDFIFIKAHDDSMSPRICKGDDVQIDTSMPIEEGKVVAVELDENILFRRLYRNMDGYLLVADNKDYPPIMCAASQILGVAVRVHIDVDKLLERDYS